MTASTLPLNEGDASMNRRFAFAVALAAGLLAPPALADVPTSTAAPRRIGFEDLARLVRVSDPQVSPDGNSIVIVVSRPNYDDNRHEAELVVVDVATGAQRVLTRGRQELAHPRWSPAGDRLAFLAKGTPRKTPKVEPAATPAATEKGAPPIVPDEEGHRQIFVMPMDGGDALQITDAFAGVQQFAWRPDGGALAFVTEDVPANREAMKKGEDAFEVGDNDYLAQQAALPSHIWLVPAEGGVARRLTSGGWSLPVSEPPGPPSSPLSWSPDGRQIAFARQDNPHFGDADRTSIQILEVASGALRPLTGRTLLEGFPSYSPDGARIALWYPRDGDPNAVNEIHVVPAAGGEPKVVTRAIDRCLYRSIWMPDSRSLLVGGNDGTRVSLWLQPLDGPARRLDLGKANPSWSFWIDAAVAKNGAVAFTGSEPQHPTELYYMASPDAAPRRLTSFNDPVASLDLGRVETIEWQGPDRLSENGVLIYPPGFDARKRFPLVLLIHGGPQAASTESFSTFGQLLAARGYVVFQPNYRGSDNLGNAYQRAIVNNAGDGPGRDVMAGLKVVQARGFVDPGRIGVSGWSYGGYMTSWLIGHYDVWKAAVTGATVSDFIDQYNLADFNVQARWSFGGSPWTGGRDKAYREQSPITYAQRVKTPTLILSNTGDARVPVTQSYRLYHALKDNGVPTRFVAWPVPGHFPADPVRSRSVYREWIGWLDAHLIPMPDGTPASPPGDKAPALPDDVKPVATGASPR
jgi:dipeptidyl aminopeptidase/acylaminoacyl peptidase